MRSTLAIALAFVAAVLTAAGGRPAGADEVAAAESPQVRFVDAVPQGPSVAARLAEIQRRIEEALVYPPLARMQRIEGEALVHFAIEHDGTPKDVVVHRSSGKPSLDRAATLAVEAAVPLPWVYGRLEVPVRSAGRSRAARRDRRLPPCGSGARRG
jgi:TonB family protein